MVKVDFVIGGWPKCGTTTLWEMLVQHPQVFDSGEKEPNWFMPNHEIILPKVPKGKLLGDASPRYSFTPASANLIYAHNPKAKVILLTRDREAFLRSYHAQNCLNSDEDQTFDMALALEETRMKGKSIPKRCRNPSWLFYSDIADYETHIERWDTIFGDNLLLITLEGLIKYPQETFRVVCKHLGIDDGFEPVFLNYNPRKTHRSEWLRDRMRDSPGPVRRFLNLVVPSPMARWLWTTTQNINLKEVKKK